MHLNRGKFHAFDKAISNPLEDENVKGELAWRSRVTIWVRQPKTTSIAKTIFTSRLPLFHATATLIPLTSYDDAEHNMVPNQAPPTSATIIGPMPPLMRSTILPANAQSVVTDHSLLTPEDAIYQGSPPRRPSAAVQKLQKDLRMTNGEAVRQPRREHKDRDRSGSRRKATWKKLLWVKQSCEYG